MLLWCRAYTKAAINAPHITSTPFWVVNQMNKGMKRRLPRAASEEILNVRLNASQVVTVSKPTTDEMPNKDPKLVATPLPPLKPKNTGYK